jgi:1-acyl-sn-glycerol-3-phosphate acyltransferase
MIVLYIILAFIGIVALWFLLLYVSGLFIDTSKEYDTNSRYYRFLLNFSTAIGMKVCRIRIKTSGMEKLPQSGRFLLVSNHRSNFDPLITWHIFAKYDLAFISKPENFKIPFFGKIIRKCCFMSIDRHDSEKANITKERAAMLLKNDIVNVAVYPEGTRSKTGDMLPFHNGIFNIAKEAGVPIVVMTLKGTPDIKSNYPWHRSDIDLDVIEFISSEDVAAHTPHELGVHVRESMLKTLGH